MSQHLENFQAISKAKHTELRVKSFTDCKHLQHYNNSVIVAEEIAEIAASCPVAFLKDEDSGRFQLSAIFGLMPNENLLVNEQGKWLGTYIPVNFNIKPFSASSGDTNAEDWLHIDINSSNVSTTLGHKLFENDVETDYLTQMRQQLESVIDASVQTEKLTEELVNRNLITEFKLIIEGLTEEPQVISDLYTINTDEFAYLTNDDIVLFHEMRYWGAIYAMQHSMKQFKKLVQLRNSRNPNSHIKLTIHIDRENSD